MSLTSKSNDTSFIFIALACSFTKGDQGRQEPVALIKLARFLLEAGCAL